MQVDDLRLPPSNRLEKLGDDLKGQWSFRVNQPWRICFRWVDGDRLAGTDTLPPHRWLDRLVNVAGPWASHLLQASGIPGRYRKRPCRRRPVGTAWTCFNRG